MPKHMTTKGQVTIPQHLSTQFDLFPGTEIDFPVRGNVLLLQKFSRHRRTAEIIKRMTQKGTVEMTTDEIMALTRR